MQEKFDFEEGNRMKQFAIIGCGRIAKRHADLLSNMQISGGKLVAVCDVNLNKASAFGEKYGVPYYTDIDEMMEKEIVDICSVLTESGHHAKHVIQVAKYGCDVIVEKPMALTIEDADSMIHACDVNNCELFVIKQNRFNVPVVKAREALDKGKFGKITLGTVRVRWARHQEYYDQDKWRGTWSLDGGVLTNQASHHIDLLQWFMGDVESVVAKSTTALADIEAEDTAIVLLKFKNGGLGIIEATTATRPNNLEGSISLLGTKGTVVIGGIAVNELVTWKFDQSEDNEDEVIEKYSVNPPNVYGFGHKEYYDQVIACLNDGLENPVSGKEGRKSLELIHAIYKSIETGQEIRLSEKPRSKRLGIAKN